MPIALTEALGCQRCQKIFVMEPESQTISLLSSPYPDKRQWQWNGKTWFDEAEAAPPRNWLSLAVIAIVVIVAGYLLLSYFGNKGKNCHQSPAERCSSSVPTRTN
jgi:hypothetical protein